MSRTFKGRVITKGTAKAEALVSHGGLNTLASYQQCMMFGDKKVRCGDQNNPDLYKKSMIGKAMCLPTTIGSTTGGMALFTVCDLGKNPACMLFSESIDSLAASGAILASVWSEHKMPVVDRLGQEFLDYVKDGMMIELKEDGVVVVE
ncbi:MAG: aconitase X swivel domain-containing protein [Candidatus Limivicinus sp.]|jgi:predicted aconitase with swiveling domain